MIRDRQRDFRQTDTQEKLREILEAMSRTLARQLTALDQLAANERLQTFVRYREVRERYLECRDLIDAMAERLPPVRTVMPAGFDAWLVKNKLRALAAFTRLSHDFFQDPPETVRISLGAYEVLSEERDSFDRAMNYFDNMLLEAALDDKSADALEETRERIQRTLGFLDILLRESPKQLQVFA